MPQESRLKKSLLNARVNLIFYVLSLALSFFSRKIFLDALGADFMGLIGTLNNLLGFLNWVSAQPSATFCINPSLNTMKGKSMKSFPFSVSSTAVSVSSF